MSSSQYASGRQDGIGGSITTRRSHYTGRMPSLPVTRPISSVHAACQDRSGHGGLGIYFKPQGAGHFTDAGETGGSILGGFVALDLLFVKAQAIGQRLLAQPAGDASLNQRAR